MRGKTIVLFLTGVIFAAALFFSGCGGKEEAQPAPGNVFVTRLSNPDESLNAIIKETDRSLWGNYLDPNTGIKAEDRLSICFEIGMKSANALLAVFLGDYDTAEKIGEAIKKAADKLNIKSESVETVVKKLADDLKERDEKTKERAVKRTLNMLQDQVVNALESIGNKNEALMIEFGAWIEALRQTSGIVRDDYSETAASVFRREVEARYFKTSFQTIHAAKAHQKYRAGIEVSSRLLELMKPKVITEEAVKEIHQLTTQ